MDSNAVEACGITCHRRLTSRRRRLTSRRKISWQRRRNRTAMNRPFSAVVNIHLNHPFGIQMILPNSLITVRMKERIEASHVKSRRENINLLRQGSTNIRKTLQPQTFDLDTGFCIATIDMAFAVLKKIEQNGKTLIREYRLLLGLRVLPLIRDKSEMRMKLFKKHNHSCLEQYR